MAKSNGHQGEIGRLFNLSHHNTKLSYNNQIRKYSVMTDTSDSLTLNRLSYQRLWSDNINITGIAQQVTGLTDIQIGSNSNVVVS